MTAQADPSAYIGGARREVRAATREGQPTKIVVAGRHFDAPTSDVWDAITDPERIPRWFLPVSGDLREGGHYQLQGNAGGRIHRCEAPRLLAVTWEIFGATSWVEVELSEHDGGTRLELRHEQHIDPHWEQFGPGAVGVGWDLALLGMAIHLDTGAAVDPEGFQTWSTSPAGIDFVADCALGWQEADIDGGEDPELARQRGAQVEAFFTGAGGDGEPTGE